jgi:hypothetical protein
VKEYKAGDIVESRAGHDKGLFCVIGEETGLLLLANGKQRPLEKPKRKKPMHVKPSGLPGIEVPENNKRLRAALAIAKYDKVCGGSEV